MGLFGKKKKDGKQAAELEKKEMKVYIPGAGGTIVSKSVLNGERPLKWVFRMEDSPGNGWVAFGDGDSQEYVNDPKNMSIVDFNTLANIEPAVVNIFYMPPGADLELCEDAKGKYFVDTQTGAEIREPVKNPLQVAFENNLKFLRSIGKELPVDWVQGVFRESEKVKPFTVGMLDCPTGALTAADPLAYLGNEKCAPILNRTIPPGKYPVELAVLRSKTAGLRYAAARLKVSDKKAEKYELAMPNGYTIEQYNTPGVFSMFGVDTGLACFCDVAVANETVIFMNVFAKKHPQTNIYDEYFAAIFAESYGKDSENQREGGDYIDWVIPATDHHLIMFSSGLGDGAYSAYWGLDESGEVAEVVIPFMDPECF